jgi:ABC-2 type transport system permease protein
VFILQRVIRVLTLDMKMKGFFKGTIISLLILLGFLLVGIGGEILFLNYPRAAIKDTAAAFLSLLPYIILATLSISLTREFENKTDKTIFTGIFTRTEIIISKLMSFIATGLVCCVFYIAVSIIFGGFSFEGAVNSVMTFVIYTFALGSFTLLVSAITSNGIITGLIIYGLHFDLSLALLGQAIGSTKSLFVKNAIENLPFFIANTGFKAGVYTFQQAFVMIFCGVLALIITFVIINRKNI